MNYKLSLILTAAMFGMVAGCAKDEGPAPVTDPAVLIRGLWQSTCSKPERFGVAEASAMSLNGEQAVITTRASTREADCGLNDIETVYVNKYTVGKAPAEDASLIPVEHTPVSVKIKPVSEVGASALRIRKFCGTEEWNVGEEKDVTANVAKGERNCASKFRASQTVKLEGDRLYSAETGRSTQPTTVDRNRFFVKKGN